MSDTTEKSERAEEFEAHARAPRRTSLIVEFCVFLKHNKKWWLLPILLALLLLGLLVLLSASSSVAPFIYTLF